MDNKKIGDLISKLRKEKGLTQQALGDLVGVGSGAVSKWERGLTLPDIGIINELSQILGISSDELLSGEIKEQSISEVNVIEEINDSKEEYEINNQKINKYNLKKILLLSIPIILIITLIIILYNNNKTYAYNILSTSEEYYVEGKVIFQGDNISIVVNKIRFLDEEFNSTIIKNYEYEISSKNNFIIGFGFLDLITHTNREQTIKEFFKKFNINYSGQIDLQRNKIVKNNITITLNFVDKENNELTTKVEFLLEPIKK